MVRSARGYWVERGRSHSTGKMLILTIEIPFVDSGTDIIGGITHVPIVFRVMYGDFPPLGRGLPRRGVSWVDRGELFVDAVPAGPSPHGSLVVSGSSNFGFANCTPQNEFR
jgi:hypothetical protein